MNPDFRTKNRQHFEKIDSTHDFLCNILSKTNPHQGFCVTSDYQSGGRGQIGRSWHSSSGKNLLVSMVFYPKDMRVSLQFGLTVWVSCSLLNVLNNLGIKNLSIKWPNDLYVGENKIAGILIQNTLRGDLIKNCVVSIGLNVNETTFPPDLPNPTSVCLETGEQKDIETLLEEIRNILELDFEKIFSPTHKEAFRNMYLTKLFGKSAYYKYRDNEGQEFYAMVHHVDEDGRLFLKRKNGEIGSYLFRQVELVR